VFILVKVLQNQNIVLHLRIINSLINYSLTKSNIMNTQNFQLKFGKHKGQMFHDTPKSYQTWLLNQDWFKVPTQLDALTTAQKQFTNAAKSLNNWNGYSRRGQAAYDSMFEAEKAMDDAYFNDPDPCSPRWNGEYNF